MPEYIDREKAVDALLTEMCMTGYQSRSINAIRVIKKEDVAPVVHGKWKSEATRKPFLQILYMCSKCGYLVDRVSNYCPNCGAKMDG